MSFTFQDWLIEQQHRQDQIGELARVLKEKQAADQLITLKGRQDEHKHWADIVTRHGEPESIWAFNHAWQEFLAARDAFEDEPPE